MKGNARKRYAIRKAKLRVETISKHTGFKIDIDESYFMNLSPGQAEKKLAALSWKNIREDKKFRFNKGISVAGTGFNPYIKVKRKEDRKIIVTPLTNKEASDLAKAIAEREYLTKEVLPANVVSKLSVKKVKEFYRYLTRPGKYEEWEREKRLRSYNNIEEKLHKAYILSGDEAFHFLQQFFIEKVTISMLFRNYSHSKWQKLTDTLKFNIYDSKSIAELASSSPSTLKAILEYLNLNDEDIKEYAYSKYRKKQANKILKKLGIL